MKRSPIFRNSDERLRRIEREAQQSPDDAALQEQLERELIRVQGGDLVPQWRSWLLADLEAFCVSLGRQRPNWAMLERLNGVMADFAGLDVDSVQRRHSNAIAEYGWRDGMSMWGGERLVREVGLQGLARAIANATSQQIRRYMARRDEVVSRTDQWSPSVRTRPRP